MGNLLSEHLQKYRQGRGSFTCARIGNPLYVNVEQQTCQQFERAGMECFLVFDTDYLAHRGCWLEQVHLGRLAGGIHHRYCSHNRDNPFIITARQVDGEPTFEAGDRVICKFIFRLKVSPICAMFWQYHWHDSCELPTTARGSCKKCRPGEPSEAVAT